MTLEELARQTAPRTSRDPGLRRGPLPRRARLDMYFIDHGQVTDTQGEPLAGEELAALADRFSEHAGAAAGKLPGLPVTVEFISDQVRAVGRTLTKEEGAALAVHVASLAR
ncbi:hypothetical protein [Nocardiopsis aegyptia]|uniref:Uncharacterized protein n=1 Tax=Nocardiopsis aegyptia TaxID=220378 RepID=A0A7Z0EJX6_9ACTN|nr:hypothetical protein [Nocardiopsis aegyptia]NYJ33458.1 hypothetical protein [Nocardiopsis aegyptia]